MRAVDTNVLVRLIANDDAGQVEVVRDFFRNCASRAEPIFVSILVMCELVWVLDRSYGRSKGEIIAVMDRLLETGFLRFEQERVLRLSLERYRKGKASFPDYIIGAIAAEAGCRDTVSFDRDLKGAPGFTIL